MLINFDPPEQNLSPDHFQKRAEYHLGRLRELFLGVHQRTNRRELQAIATALKEEMKRDWNLACSRRVYVSLSRKEREAAAAIEKARCHLHFAVNSDPIRSRWADYVGTAESDLKLWLSRLT